MRRVPFTLIAAAVSAALLGVWMVWDGLHGRLFGSFLPLLGRPAPWLVIPRALGVDPQGFAWPILLLGTSWIGALSGMLVGLRWAVRACWVVGILSLLYLGPGTVLGLIALLCLRLPATRAWLEKVAAAYEQA